MENQKNNLILIILIFFSLKIGCISYFSSFLNSIWYAFQVFSILFSLYFLIIKSKTNKFDFSVILFYLVLLIVTLINKVNIYNYVKEIISFFSLYFVMRFGLEYNPKIYIKNMSRLLIMYTIINTITTILLYPGAMFMDNLNPIFFMGGDNTAVRVYVFAVCFEALSKFIKKQKIKFPYISFINIALFSYVRDLGGGKACTIILFFCLIYFIFSKKIPQKIIKKIILLNIVLFLLIVIFNKINIFQFLIVNILHRNLTLTDRTIIWKITIEKIIQKPLIGYGMIDGMDFQSMLPNIIGVNAHNTYLMILFNGGIILLLSFINVLILAAKKFDQVKHNKFVYILPLILLTLMIRAQIEGWDIVWIFLILQLIYSYDKIEALFEIKPIEKVVN